MPFMKPDVFKGEAWRVETTHGTFFVPADVESDPDKLGDYVEGVIEETPEKVHGWLGRMSAPGYMDCTDWCFGETEEGVLEQLRDFYGLDDERDDEDKADDESEAK